jgi:hypothetical protein
VIALLLALALAPASAATQDGDNVDRAVARAVERTQAKLTRTLDPPLPEPG